MFDLQRIRKLINWLIFMDYGKSDAEIAQKLGYTRSSFSQILGGKVPVSQNFVDKLCLLDENINKVWISGQGEMLNKGALYTIECAECKEKDTLISAQKKTVEAQQQLINTLKEELNISFNSDGQESCKMVEMYERLISAKDETIRSQQEAILALKNESDWDVEGVASADAG